MDERIIPGNPCPNCGHEMKLHTIHQGCTRCDCRHGVKVTTISEYTPTTGMVRFGFSASDSTATSEELSAQFERWIAAHDREIKRSALLEWTNYQESMMMDAFAYVLDDEDVAETKTWVAAVRSYVDMFYPT